MPTIFEIYFRKKIKNKSHGHHNNQRHQRSKKTEHT